MSQHGSPAAGGEFHITGNVGAIATGQFGQATGTVHSSASDDPLEMLDRLLSKLKADAGGLLEGEQAEEILDDAERLHTEVHSRRPKADIIRLVLSRLTKTAGSAAALLATVDQIKDLVSAILN